MTTESEPPGPTQSNTYDQDTMIISVNLDKRLSSWLKLEEAINIKRSTIIAIQDPPSASSELWNRIVTLASAQHQIIIDSTLRSAAFIVDKTRVTVTQTHCPVNAKACSIGIRVKIEGFNNDKEVLIFSAYIRPRASALDLEQCLQEMSRHIRGSEANKSNTLIMGDFNATSHNWEAVEAELGTVQTSDKHYDNIKINRGRRLMNFIKENKLWCANTINKRTSHGTSCIDLTLMGNKLKRKFASLDLIELGAGAHKAANIRWLKRTTQVAADNDECGHTRCAGYRYDKIRAEHFLVVNLEAQKLINSWQSLERDQIINRMNILANKLYESMLGVQRLIRYDKHRQHSRAAKNQNNYIKKQIVRLTKLENRIKKQKGARKGGITRHRTARRAATNKLNKQRRKVLNAISRDRITDSAETSGEHDLWNMMKEFDRICAPNTGMDEQQQLPNLGEQRAVDLVALTKFPCIDRNFGAEYEDIMKHGSLHRTYINESEFEAALYDLRKKRHTGPEGLRYETFLKACAHTRNIIWNICKMSFHAARSPDVCSNTIGHIIPKKSAGQFRIVHVGTPLSGLLEQIALHRLEHRLDLNNLINNRQYGFTARRGRHDLIARIIEVTAKNRMREGNKALTTIVNLDIDGAFDNVNHKLLLDKMMLELEPDTVQYWLGSFLLKRSITVKYNNLASKKRVLGKGVPQGSPLGPILWNFFINKIDEGMNNNNGKTEMLMYADDLFIIHNDAPNQELQQYVDTLTDKLAQMDLSVRPEKCSTMVVSFKSRAQHRSHINASISIGGKGLKTVESMRILGVTISGQLKLDMRAGSTTRSLCQAVDKLCKVNQFGFVNSAAQWRSLINSYLISTIIDNNAPILAIDKSARDSIDRLIIKAVKTIFGWPSSASNRLIRLILGLPEAQTRTQKIINKGKCSEHRASYDTVDKIMHSTGSWCNKGASMGFGEISDISNSYEHNRRRYGNPAMLFGRLPVISTETQLKRTGPIWLIGQQGKDVICAEALFGNIIQHKRIRHVVHRNHHFGTLGALWLLSNTDNKEHYTNRLIGLREVDPVLAALRNANQHDWRIITLREQLFSNGWRVFVVSKKADRAMNDMIAALRIRYNEYDKGQRGRDDCDEHDFNADAWLQRTNNEMRTILTDDPEASDYRKRAELNKINREQTRQAIKKWHTTVTRILCDDADIWQEYPPGWLCATNMLTLTGVVQNELGTLVSGRTATGDIPPGCGPECRRMSDQEDVNAHASTHRLFVCPRFEELRQGAMSAISEANSINKEELTDVNSNLNECKLIENTLRHRRLRQRLIKMLSNCAFAHTMRQM